MPSPKPALFRQAAVAPGAPRREKRSVRRRPRSGDTTEARQMAVDAMAPPTGAAAPTPLGRRRRARLVLTPACPLTGGDEFEFDLFDDDA